MYTLAQKGKSVGHVSASVAVENLRTECSKIGSSRVAPVDHAPRCRRQWPAESRARHGRQVVADNRAGVKLRCHRYFSQERVAEHVAWEGYGMDEPEGQTVYELFACRSKSDRWRAEDWLSYLVNEGIVDESSGAGPVQTEQLGPFDRVQDS